MTPDEAPPGTILKMGVNGQTATKQYDGRWLYNLGGSVLDRLTEPSYDDVSRSSALFIPGHKE